MSAFSSIACYSALRACSKDDILSAYARMVAALVQKKRYERCEAEVLCSDFEVMYGFEIPYHPMCTIMKQCEQFGYFTYNSSSHAFFPNFDSIDSEDFLDIIQKKDDEYKKLLAEFNEFLINQHDIHSSQEDLDEKIRAFIERYGIKSKSDRDVLRKVKDDFLFAEFLVHCEENGRGEILDYLDEYIVGVALSEIFTYSEFPNNFTAKNARVYLDTSLLFRLFGIDSSSRADSYTEYIRNMQRIGIRVMVYEHTVNEMIGIIESSKHWIGNPDYDATLSSEATFYFVSNNWSVDRVDELSVNIRTRLLDEYNIQIDKMTYPKVEDIHTPYEADIRAKIVERYVESDPNRNIDDISYSIDQDAKSIFFTLHKNGNRVAYHIDDIENVFVTTNRSLVKVGCAFSHDIAQSKEVFIPAVMNDINWGTLIWFNSPALISSISRPRLVSAAYAAFKPSPELTKKLNSTLIKLEGQGKITPDQCYLLKVNPIAQHLLTHKTINDPERFVDATPLEILKELGREAFEQGSASRQAEVDMLTEQSEAYKVQLAKEQQEKVIFNLKKEGQLLAAQIKPVKERIRSIQEELKVLNNVKSEIDAVVKSKCSICKIVISILVILIIGVPILLGNEFSWILGAISFITPMVAWLIALWSGTKITYAWIQHEVETHTREKQNKLRRYSDSQLQNLKQELDDQLSKLRELQNKENEVFTNLAWENGKADRFSIDTSLLDKVTL